LASNCLRSDCKRRADGSVALSGKRSTTSLSLAGVYGLEGAAWVAREVKRQKSAAKVEISGRNMQSRLKVSKYEMKMAIADVFIA
jgi:hypothetical protein